MTTLEECPNGLLNTKVNQHPVQDTVTQILFGLQFNYYLYSFWLLTLSINHGEDKGFRTGGVDVSEIDSVKTTK